MALGLFLILIVIIPLCIYLYIMNKQLQEEINILKKENKTILERKILKENNSDIKSIEDISNKLKTRPRELSNEENNLKGIENINCRSGIPIIPNNNDNINKTRQDTIIEKSSPIELTNYEKEEEEKAIISYQELKKHMESNKEKNTSETEQFLQDLKNFRNNLKM